MQQKERMRLTEVARKKETFERLRINSSCAKSLHPGNGHGLEVRHSNQADQEQSRIGFCSLPWTTSLLILTSSLPGPLFPAVILSCVHTS